MRSTWISRFKPGDTAPDFQATLQDGSSISSASLKGSSYILFFYNHDGSETCTKEACNLRDNFDRVAGRGFRIFGVSEDSEKKHQRFISKFQLPFPLISDKNNKVAKTFDVFGTKEFMGRVSETVHRTTFVIDDNGIILSVIHPVDSARHAQQIIESLSSK